MIKALLSTGDGEKVVLLGITPENMVRLMNDEPILVDLAELGLPAQKVVIVGGATPELITANIYSHLSYSKPADNGG